MPPKNDHSNVALPAGQGTVRGAARYKTLRRRPAFGTFAPAISNGGFRAVTFKSKGSYSIAGHLKLTWVDGYALEDIYNDLYGCYRRYYELLHGRPPVYEGKDIGADLDRALDILLYQIKQLCEPYLFNIERQRNDSGPFAFVIFEERDYTDGWQFLEVKPVLKKLKRKSKGLHNLFVLFLAAFRRQTKIDFWTDGYFHEILEWRLEEGLINWEYDDEEARSEVEKTGRDYRSGEASYYMQQVKKLADDPTCNIETIIKLLAKYRSCTEIIELIRIGCDFLKQPGNMEQYCYWPHAGVDDDWEPGLLFESQANVVWDVNDPITDMYCQSIDMDAQQGIYPPYQYLIVTPDCREVFEPNHWPMKLLEFFKAANDLTNRFTDEQAN